jgi:hypothetical protein
MYNTGHYIAFPCSDELRATSREFIGLMKCPSPKTQSKKLTSALSLFADEIIDAFLIDMVRKTELNGPQRKLLEMADAGLKKTAHAVINRFSSKLDIKQQTGIADHIDSCLLPIERDNPHQVEFVAIPITEAFSEELRESYNKPDIDGVDSSVHSIVANQKVVIDRMFEFLIDRLLSIVKLGAIAQKVVGVAASTCLKMMHSTTEKLLSGMSEAELKIAVGHFEEMLITAPQQAI